MINIVNDIILINKKEVDNMKKSILFIGLAFLSMFLLVSCVDYGTSSTDENHEDTEEMMEETDMDESSEEESVSEEIVEEVMEEIEEDADMMEDVQIVEEVNGDEYVATIVPGMPEAVEESVVSTGDITLLGPNGFDVSEYNVAVGQSVSFVNMNEKGHSDLDISLTFQNVDKRSDIMLSDLILYEETYSHTFTAAGQWKVWSVEYGGDLVITVS